MKFFRDTQVQFCQNGDYGRVPWILLFFEFASAFPSLDEWKDLPSLHAGVSQFSSAVKRCFSGVIKPYLHCLNLKEFRFGRLSGFLGCFRSNHPVRATCLSLCASSHILESPPASSKGPGVVTKHLKLPLTDLLLLPSQ